MTKLLAVSHPDDLTIGSITSGWLMGIVGCHPDDLRYFPISSGWHNVIWTLSHPDELAPGRISSGWLLDTAVCHPDDISHHRMSSGRLSRNWYLIRMSYDKFIMSSGWHRLPFLSHPDEIGNFDFPHHAVALQCFRNIQGAVSIRKTVLPGMAIPMLKIRRPNGRLIFNMEITIRR